MPASWTSFNPEKLGRICFFFSWAALGGNAAGEDPQRHFEQIRPILEKHCIACHGSEQQKSSIRFDGIEGNGEAAWASDFATAATSHPMTASVGYFYKAAQQELGKQALRRLPRATHEHGDSEIATP